MLFLFVLMLVGRDALRLADRDTARAAGGRHPASASASPACVGTLLARARRRHPTRVGLDEANRERQRAGHRLAAVHQLRVRVRGDLGAADHGGGRRDGAGAHPQAEERAARASPTSMRLRFRPRQLPRPSAGPGRATPPHDSVATPARGCRTARSAERSIPEILPTRELEPARDRPEGHREMNPSYYLVLAGILFTIGAVGVLIRRNAIVVFMCIELMLNAANLALVTFSRINGNPQRADHRVLRHGRRRRRGRGRSGDHHDDLPDAALGERR